jgi:hypothetical protein
MNSTNLVGGSGGIDISSSGRNASYLPALSSPPPRFTSF